MAIPKKGARVIMIDGIKYRWRVRNRPTYSQGLLQSGVVLAVEVAENQGSTLIVELSQWHKSNWLNAESEPILPSVVETSIRRALFEGWQSTLNGKQFHLKG